MKTSFHDIVETEKYLQRALDPGDAVVFEARLLVSGDMRRNVFFHKVVHRLVRIYHRKKLKAEVAAVHQRLFSDPSKASFRNHIANIFKR
jgi:hypothetical protein